MHTPHAPRGRYFEDFTVGEELHTTLAGGTVRSTVLDTEPEHP